LGSPLQLLTDPRRVVDLADQDSIDALYASPAADWGTADVRPGQLALCAANQPLRLGPGLAAVVATLSHLARAGLATHVDSPWVMPGWDGHLTLELLNVGPAVLRLRQSMPVARVIIWRMDGLASAPAPHAHYGRPDHLGSRYAIEFGSQLTTNATRA